MAPLVRSPVGSAAIFPIWLIHRRIVSFHPEMFPCFGGLVPVLVRRIGPFVSHLPTRRAATDPVKVFSSSVSQSCRWYFAQASPLARVLAEHNTVSLGPDYIVAACVGHRLAAKASCVLAPEQVLSRTF